MLFKEEKKVTTIPVSEVEIVEHTPLDNYQIELTAGTEEEAPQLPKVDKAPFVAEEPDIFEPDSIILSVEPIAPAIVSDDKNAPATLVMIQKPFYALEDSKE